MRLDSSSRFFVCRLAAVAAGALLLAGSASAQSCAGDCNGDAQTSFGELFNEIRLVLGERGVLSCAAMDWNSDGVVSIEDLVGARNSAGCGCGRACPTVSATRTRTSTVTRTRTPAPTLPPPSFTPTPSPTASSRPTATLPAPSQILFRERWERAAVRRYAPDSVFAADSGSWFVGDTVSEEGCLDGPSPNYGEVLVEGGSRRFRLHSENTNSGCAENVFAGPAVANLALPADPGVYLSFHETGRLNSIDDCQAVFVGVGFNTQQSLLYVLERSPDWDDGPEACEDAFRRNAIRLPIEPSGTYVRNLAADAATLGLARPVEVRAIGLEVDYDGEATFDDITIFRIGTAPPTPTRTPTPRADNCIRVQTGDWCLLFKSGGLTVLGADGSMRQSGCVVSFDELEGALVGNRWRVESEEVDITGTFSGNPARSFSGSTSNGLTISGSAGGCP